jgi:hypothetical protein
VVIGGELSDIEWLLHVLSGLPSEVNYTSEIAVFARWVSGQGLELPIVADSIPMLFFYSREYDNYTFRFLGV